MGRGAGIREKKILMPVAILSFYHLPLSFKLPLVVEHLLLSNTHMVLSIHLHVPVYESHKSTRMQMHIQKTLLFKLYNKSNRQAMAAV